MSILIAYNALADGTEVLRIPSIGIQSGSSMVTGGVGLDNDTGVLSVNVPGSAIIQQVILYWAGRGDGGDNSIDIDGNTITGSLIGGPTSNPIHPSRTYRADITGLDLISPGNNSFNVSGLDFGDQPADGAGIVVIFNDNISTAYGGRAKGVSATVGPDKVTAVDTGELPREGGVLEPQPINNTEVLDILTATTVSAQSTGAGSESTSMASVEDLDAVVSSIGISADLLSSEASAQCTAGGADVNGDSRFANLVIDGLINLPVSFTPNTVLLNLLGIKIIANQQIVTGNGNSRAITVNALRITAPEVKSLFGSSDAIDLKVASSRASINCQAAPEAEIAIFDGNDYAFERLEGKLQTTRTRTFTFSPTTFDRVARLDYFVTDAEVNRPDTVVIKVPGTPVVRRVDTLDSSSGREFDADTVSVFIPAGASQVKVRMLSERSPQSTLTREPDSLSWIMAALTVPTGQQGNVYSGRGIVLQADVAGLTTTTVGDTGALPSTGGDLSSTLNELDLGNLAQSSTASASTVGAGDDSDTHASVEELELEVLGIRITADLIQSSASAECSSDNTASFNGDSLIANLNINGKPVKIDPETTEIILPLGARILINEKFSERRNNIASVTVNALHIIVPDHSTLLGDPLANVIVASSHADIACQ